MLESLEDRQLLAAQPIIAEFMAINASGLTDADGDYSDWLEIGNIGDAPADLSGWYLTDDASDLGKWQLPNVSVASGAQLVVFASDKDRTAPLTDLHTNFRLTGGGEYLALVRPDGVTIEHDYRPAYPAQVADISYGLFGAARAAGYFSAPSPGAPNAVAGTTTPPQAIVINEIMYHPSSENLAEEYIELTNIGTVAVDLSGWRISSGVNVTLPNIVLQPGAYQVIAANVTTFAAAYGAGIPVTGPWTGDLGNSSNTITLRDAANQIVDRVTYADEGDWAVRARGPVDEGTRGWIWLDSHDGGGKSLELRGAHLPNEFGQNWAASQQDGGSPGRANSVAASDLAPLIVDVDQQPIIPTASDVVRITAKVVDESRPGVTVNLNWRVDGTPNFVAQLMRDDGLSGDLLAGDGVYYADLPAAADRSVIEYYVSAVDAAGARRNWPAPTVDEGQTTNALYQVIDEFDPLAVAQPGSAPIYYQIMTAAERLEFTNIARASDAQLNATFVRVSSEGVTARHNAGIRIRGSGSRRANPPNNRVNLPSDRALDGRTAFNFNVDTVRNQIAGSLLFRLAGLPSANANAARMYSNGTDLFSGGMYALVEPLGSDFTQSHFPSDNDGNLYKGRRSNESPSGGLGAGLRYFGDDPAPYVSYTKLTNESVADYSDVIELTDVLNNTPDETFLEDVARVVDIDQWLRYFAFNWVISNTEGGLVNGDTQGDDYAMYRGVEDRRFIMLSHDLDSILSNVTRDNPFRATSVAPLRRLLLHESIKPRYYAQIFDLVDNVLLAPETEGILRQSLAGVASRGQIDGMVGFLQQRADYIRATIPQGLDFTTALPIEAGRISTDETRLGMYGTADYRANSVLINGQLAQFVTSTNFWQIGSYINTIVSPDSEWRYLDNGSDPGTAWRDFNFVPGPAWGTGRAELGYGDGDEATVVGFGNNPTEKHITTYFRQEFTVTDPERYATLVASVVRDDGLALYLNGQEVYRNNMPNGELTPTTLASSNITGGGERAQNFATLDASMLRAGTNVLAAEVHQAMQDSEDLSFSLGLSGRYNPKNEGVDLLPGVNSLFVQAMTGTDGTGEVVASAVIEVWRDTGNPSLVEGDLPADVTTTWSLANSPYQVRGDVNVLSGSKLVIEPGVSVYFEQDAELIVAGELIAEGTAQRRIRFTSVPGLPDVPDLDGLPNGPARWDGIHFTGSRSDANKIAFADIEYAQDNDGAVGVLNSNAVIDNISVKGTHLRMIYANNASLVVSNSTFPDMFAENEQPNELGLDNISEHIKIIGRTPAGGRLVIQANRFGTNKGHNDVIDADSNRVDRGPILQILDNVFAGAGDELLDLGGDVYVAGNLFQGVFKDDTTSDRGYANVISTGDAGADRTIVVTRNVFFDVDHAINLKESNVSIFEYNTVVTIHPDFLDRFDHPNVGSIVNLYVDEPGATSGAGAYVGYNIISDVPRIFGNADLPENVTSALQLSNNVLDAVADTAISGTRLASILTLGTGNVVEPPRFVDRDNAHFSVRIGSAARNPAQPTIWGADAPAEIWISGEPARVTPFRNHELKVGGPGLFAYRYRVNQGSWTDDLPIGTGFNPNGTVRTATIALNGLPDGDYTVEVEGIDFAGNRQAVPSISKTWTVQGNVGQLVISEVLANNVAAVPNVGDLIELHNNSNVPVNLKGVQLSDNPDRPGKYVFPDDLIVPGGAYLTLLADSLTGPGTHVGFSLSSNGEAVYLHDATGELLDFVEFGVQVPDLAIGRVAGIWQATEMTVNAANRPARLGDPAQLTINEWMAEGRGADDFIELYNRDTLPVAVGGFYLSDAGDGEPQRHRIADLSFIAARGYQAYLADGNSQSGPNHLNFQLSLDGETLRLSDSELREIDTVPFTPQTVGVSQGRLPDGDPGSFAYFDLPSPGWVNGGGVVGDIDANGVINAIDIDQLCVAIRSANGSPAMDLNRDGVVDLADQRFLIEEILKTTVGDSTLDGVFDSRDIVAVFQAGQYEDNVVGGSTWSTGDWNCDGEFGTRDLVLAFQVGGYVNAAHSTTAYQATPLSSGTRSLRDAAELASARDAARVAAPAPSSSAENASKKTVSTWRARVAVPARQQSLLPQAVDQLFGN